ncbi:MAG: hypothetical protein U1E51_23345 [Candidatus Binatia bacterium]|nr:hypothetical protein [Candidatus Binatia bacterium]
MAALTRAQLNALADSRVPSNVPQGVTAANERQQFKDTADSALLAEDIADLPTDIGTAGKLLAVKHLGVEGGAATLGDDGKVPDEQLRQFATIAALRAFEGTLGDNEQVYVFGYYVRSTGYIPGGGGQFVCDTSDTTTADDSGMCIVTASGQRLKRVIDYFITPEMFGAKGDLAYASSGDTATDDAPAWRLLAAYVNSEANGKTIRVIRASRQYRFATPDPSITEYNVCVRFASPNTKGINIQGGEANSTDFSKSCIRYANSSNALAYRSIIEINGVGSTVRDIRIVLGGIGSGSFQYGVELGVGNFPNRMHFENVGINVAANADHAIYGDVWGATFITCVCSGGNISPWKIISSTSLLLANCYATGVVGVSQYGFDLTGWYGACIDLSCDNVNAGTAYKFSDRSWTCVNLGCEGGGAAIEARAVRVVIHGLTRISSTATTELIFVAQHLEISGLSGMLASSVSGKLFRLQEGAKLSIRDHDWGYGHILYVDGDGNDLGLPKSFWQDAQVDRPSSFDPAGTVTTYPVAAFSARAGQLNFKSGVLSNITAWSASATKALGAYVRPVAGLDGRVIFKCTTAGTTGGSEPAWDTTVGNTTSDGSVVWTCEAYTSDSLGPIMGLFGSGSLVFQGNYVVARTPLRFTSPLRLLNCESFVFFSNVDFIFDLNSATTDAIQLWNCRRVEFDNCTFTFDSAARCVFGGFDTDNRDCNSMVVVRPNCTLASGNIVGQSRNDKTYYWRAKTLAPSQIEANYGTTPLQIETTRVSAFPLISGLWDGDLDVHLEEPDEDSYLSAHWNGSAWKRYNLVEA